MQKPVFIESVFGSAHDAAHRRFWNSLCADGGCLGLGSSLHRIHLLLFFLCGLNPNLAGWRCPSGLPGALLRPCRKVGTAPFRYRWSTTRQQTGKPLNTVKFCRHSTAPVRGRKGEHEGEA